MTERVRLNDCLFETYISSRSIQSEIERLGRELCQMIPENEEVVFLSVLNGSFIFTADLVRAFPRSSYVSFIRVFSYEGVSSSGKIREIMGITDQLEGKHVIIVEDIIDTGLTIDYIHQKVLALNPKSVRIVAFLFKKDAYKGKAPVHHIGFSIQNEFVVGYGLDYNGLGRNLPGIYKIINQTEHV